MIYLRIKRKECIKMTETTRYSATPALQGYWYQFDIALLEILKIKNNNSFVSLSIESIDDIVVENNGTPEAVIQVKHHNKQSNLTNTSTDLWKTLNIWCDLLLQDKIEEKSVLYLITTQSITENTIAYYLSKKDIDKAKTAILETIQSSNNNTNKPFYDKFNKLNEQKQKFLLERISIIDNSFSFDEINKELEEILYYADTKNIKNFVKRLKEWYYNKISEYFSKNEPAYICKNEIDCKIKDLIEQNRIDNLPIYDEIDSNEIDNQQFNNRMFVKQIDILQFNKDNKKLRAIKDYYKSCEYRSRWVREGKLNPNLLEKYNNKLLEEWEIRFENEIENIHSNTTEEEKRIIGRKVFKWMEESSYSINGKNFNEPFITRGSYHILADELKVGWHPKYKELLQLDNGEN